MREPRLHHSLFMVGFGNAASKVMMFAANVWIANRLGADGFGALGVAFAVVNCLYVLGYTGLDTAATHRTAMTAPRGYPALGGQVIMLRVVIGAVLLTASMVIGVTMHGAVGRMVMLYGISFIPQMVNIAPLFIGSEWPWPVAVYFVGGRIVFCALIVALVAHPGDMAMVPWSYAAAIVVESTFLCTMWARRYGLDPLMAVGLRVWRRWLSVIPIALASAGMMLHEYAVMLVLYGLRGAHDTGLYCAAHRLVFVMASVMALASTVFLARMTRVRHAAPELAHRLVYTAQIVGTTGAVVCAAASALLATSLVRLLYVPEYEASGAILRLAAWQMVCMPMRYIAFQTLNAYHRYWQAMVTVCLGSLCTCAFVAAGVGRDGLRGAVLGSIIGEIALAGMLMLQARRGMRAALSGRTT